MGGGEDAALAQAQPDNGPTAVPPFLVHTLLQQFCTPWSVLSSTKPEHNTFKDIPSWVNTETSWCQVGI